MLPCKFLVCGLLLTLAMSACDRDKDAVREASRSLARQFADSFPPSPSPQDPARALPVRLYLDGTASMRGYVECVIGEPRRFPDVVARIASGLGITRATLFGVPPGGGGLFTEIPLDRRFRCPATYNRLNNPDAALVESLSLDTVPMVSVYLTDGVQSASDADTPSPTMRALEGWIRAGKGLAILGFRGKFRGEGWSEERQGWVPGVAVDDRPFYAFVFAPSEATLEATLRRLPAEVLDSAVRMRVSALPYNCTVAPLRRGRATGMAAPPWVLLRPETTRSLVAAADRIGEFTCTLPGDHPLLTLLADVTHAYAGWHRGGFDPLTRDRLGANFEADSVQGSTVFLTARLRDDPSTRFGFYALRIRPAPGQLRADIRTLSADSDAMLADFHRTYRLSWLVDGLVRARLEQASLERPYSFTVQYR